METKTPSLEPFSLNDKATSILLIDNEDIDLFINQKLLENYGVSDIVTFKSANQALEFLKETKIIYRYIIVDMSMPVMSGFEFIDKCIELGLNKKQGDICLLTASMNPSDKEKAMEKSVRFIEKPLTLNKLLFI